MTIPVAAVVGAPVSHSLSPAIHTAWIRAAGLDAVYLALETPDFAAFERHLAEGRAGRLLGLNVTAPWKVDALARADEASDTALACGAANLLVFDQGRIVADSTDGRGLLAALSEQAPGLRLAGSSVVVLGAGGAARAAVAALAGAGAQVAVLNRTRSKAEALAEALGAEVAGPDALAGAALVVNALSAPPDIDFDALAADAVLMDMTYRPLETVFLSQGRRRGHVTVDGLAMLIGQARPSFEAIFGRPAPDVDVRARAIAAMEKAG